MTPWFSATSAPSLNYAKQQKKNKIPTKPLTVQEAVRHMNPTKPIKNVRFSSLLLEHGELIVQNWAVALSSSPIILSQQERGTTMHQKRKGNQSVSRSHSRRKKRISPVPSTQLQMMQGRLHLCTQSLVFEPLDVLRPILRFPFSKMTVLPYEKKTKQQEDDKNVESEYEIPLTIGFESTRYFRIKENNVIGPFEVVESCDKYSLTFLHSSPQILFCQLCQKLSSIKRGGGSGETDLEDVLKPMYHRPFSSSNLMPLDRPITSSLQSTLLSPLQKQPGCCLITSKQKIYFQVASYWEPGGESWNWSLAPSNWVAYARRYSGLRDTAVEWYWKDGTSTLMAFEKTRDREKAIQAAILVYCGGRNHKNDKKIVTPRCLTNPDFMYEALREWQSDRLSNYDYLMACNAAAGRTFHDWSRYPVFPWVLQDYTSETLDFNNPAIYRDLSKAMGALNEGRLEYFETRLAQLGGASIAGGEADNYDEMSTCPHSIDGDASTSMRFLYGTHYSAPGYILYYLVRSRPEHMLCLQNGKFDTPDRMFHSMAHSWNCALTNHADVKELIPEFYRKDSVVDVLWNAGSLQLGATQLGERVHHVDLPPWAENSPRKFGRYLRKALESDHVSRQLPQWIDLIFGCKSRGIAAQEAKNWFHPCSYLGPSRQDSKKKSTSFLQMELQAVEFGIVPDQLFVRAHPKKKGNVSAYVDEIEGTIDKLFHKTLGKITFYSNDPTPEQHNRSMQDEISNKETWELLEPPRDSSPDNLQTVSEDEETANPQINTEYIDDVEKKELITPGAKASASWNSTVNDSIPINNNIPKKANAGQEQKLHSSLALSGSGDLSTTHNTHEGFGGFSSRADNSASHSNVKASTTTKSKNPILSGWDMKLLEKNRVHSDTITGCSIVLSSADNTGYISSVSLDGSLLVHNVQPHWTTNAIAPQQRQQQQPSHRSFIGRLYTGGARDLQPQLQFALTTPHRRHDGSDPLACLSLTEDGQGGHLVFAGGHDDIVLAYGITSGCAVASVYSHRDAVTGLHVLSRDTTTQYQLQTSCSPVPTSCSIGGLGGIGNKGIGGNNTLWNNNTHIMVSGSWDATVKVWSVTVSGGETVSIVREPLAELFDADSTIVCLSATCIEESVAIAVGCSDGSIVVWMCHPDGTKVIIYKDKPVLRSRNNQSKKTNCTAIQWSTSRSGEVILFAGFGSGRVVAFALNRKSGTLQKKSAVSVGVAVLCLQSSRQFLLVGCADGGLRLLPLSSSTEGGKLFEGQPTLWNDVHQDRRNVKRAAITCCSILPIIYDEKWLCATGAEDGSLVVFELKKSGLE